MPKPLLLLLPLLALLPAAPGCVSLQAGGIYPQQADEVFVSYFRNDTFFRDVQFDLSERIVEEILSRPGLRLSSKEEAEVVLSGRVTSVTQRVLAEDDRFTVTTATTTITVVLEVHDAMTGNLIKTKRLSQRAEYVPNLGQSLEDARVEAFRFLARDIVRELEAEF